MSSPSKPASPGGAGLLQGSRTRSYGSLVKTVSSPVRERRLEHRLEPGDTLQGLAVKYGVTTEQIKRANRLYTNDSIFLKKTLFIPVPMEPKSLSNGLNLDEDEEEKEEGEQATTAKAGDELGPGVPETPKKQKHPRKNGSSSGVPKHDLSASDFLFKLDSEIRRSKQAATKKLRDGESLASKDDAEWTVHTLSSSSSSSSYQNELSPRSQQRALLGPVPLTKIARADSIRDQEDEIFKL
ncbi:lysM and putative peptidoglycan-binding domain-containing protein 1 [Anolis sagrei]|uniref:lysM and putative peptidoglycan-binding domain-containing protein 1 n=1 Tax=Anolis sagrei TaxID=38937 RepID=UPI003522D3D1